MLKFLCGGRSKSKVEKSKTPEFQVLILGTDKSGKLNIIEKLATLQNQFTHEDRINRIRDIKRHILDSLTSILHNFDKLSPRIKLEHLENQWRVTYILTTGQQDDFNYPPEFFEHVAALWADAGVKLSFERSNQYRLIDCTSHFFDRVNQIKENDYIPTDQDMIHSRFFKSNVYEMFFDFSLIRFRLIEVDLLREGRRKWVHCFSHVNAIIFVVNCSDFSLKHIRDYSQNDLIGSIEKFKMMMVDPWLRTKPVILLLNKQDLLAKKIKNGSHVEDYFRKHYREFVRLVEPDKVNLDEDPQINQAKCFIMSQFLKISANYGMYDHHCYPHFICDTDMEIPRLIFDDCLKIIVQQNSLRQLLR